MPNVNSGTERPYAPLLEPYTKLNLINCWEKSLRLDQHSLNLTLRDRQIQDHDIVRMLVSLGRWPPK